MQPMQPMQLRPTDRPWRKAVLVVDNETGIADFLSEVLSGELGCRIIRATRAEQALSLLDGIKVDLIVLDYHLADMNGLSLYEELKSRPDSGSTPVLLMAEASEAAVYKENGPSFFVAKPFELSYFLACVQAFLN